MSAQIRALLRNYFQHLDAHDGPAIQNDWHPQGALFLNGEARPLAFLLGLPPVIGFEIDRVERVDVTGTAASAVVAWTMKMPASTGIHVSHFGLVRGEAGWRIAAQVDFGIEKMNQEAVA